MKRAAAIIGPTPSFVRWTILQPCPFRQIDDSHPYEAFRQLRNLREVSLGLIENRVQQGFCIHATQNQTAEEARGFPVDEILAFFGTQDEIENTCGQCAANAAKHRSLNAPETQWAGCYGWMRSEQDSINLVNIFNSIAVDHFIGLPPAKQNWFRVWQNERWQEDQLAVLNRLLQQLPLSIIDKHGDLADFCDAVATCHNNQLDLATELVPAGISDAIHWKIEPHCSICKFESARSQDRCEQCGQTGTWTASSKRKVLGLRPYMILKDIIGSKQTEELIKQFHSTSD